MVVIIAGFGLSTLALADEESFEASGDLTPFKSTVRTNPVVTDPTQGFVPPVNDTCPGAVIIPDGPYPVLSMPVITDCQDATEAGDPPVPAGVGCGAVVLMRDGIWYEWTPAVGGFYRIAACAGETATTDADGVIAMYTSSDNTCAGTFTGTNCDDDSCHGVGPSIIIANFTGGQKYYILAGTFDPGSSQISQYQLEIDSVPPPSNDTCATAEPLLLETPVPGGLLLAGNDYQVGGGTACFLSSGQVGNTAAAGVGRDVVYSFTNTDAVAGRFSFRTFRNINSFSMLYVADSCPVGAPPNIISPPNCLYAANRNAPLTAPVGGSEEALCVNVNAGQTVYAFVDESTAGTGQTSHWMEVERCVREVEFNGTPAAGDANSAFAGCPVEGSSLFIAGFADIDFFGLGSPAAGTRVFTIADADAANPSSSNVSGVDLGMRVTTTTDTLEFDNNNNASFFAGRAPNIAGRELTGVPSYIRMNHQTSSASAEPYRLYTTNRAPGAGPIGTSATPETEPNDGAQVNAGDYFYGEFPDENDTDVFVFCAEKGDMIMVNQDCDPTRDNTNVGGFLALLDPSGNTPAEFGGFGVSDAEVASNNVPSPGTLTGNNPFSLGNAMVHRALVGGLYFGFTFVIQAPLSGDYLFQASLDCAVPAADLTISKTGPAAVVAGSNITYQISVTNNGPNPATFPDWFDFTPAGTTFVSITFPPEWDCVDPGVGGTGLIVCFEVATGCFTGTADFELVLRADSCVAGLVENTATVESFTGDPGPGPNSSTATTVVAGLDCNDLNDCTTDSCNTETGLCDNVPVADGSACSDSNSCTTNDSCQGGECVGGVPPNCNDGNNCTDDTCVASTGCVNTCNNTCAGDPKTQGYYKRLCRGPHASGEFISQQDADCVNNTCTFATVATPADVCDRMNPNPNNDKCEQAEAQFMALMLNICRCRVSDGTAVDSECTSNTTVGQSRADADALLCNPARTHQDCVRAQCESEEINSGQALWVNSLRVNLEPDGAIKLTWQLPYVQNERTPSQFRIWRRVASEDVYQMVGQVNGNTLSFRDAQAAGAEYQYEITGVW